MGCQKWFTGLSVCLLGWGAEVEGQSPFSWKGQVLGEQKAVGFATVAVKETGQQVVADSSGFFEFVPLPAGNYNITVTATGYFSLEKQYEVAYPQETPVTIRLLPRPAQMDEVVVTGTLKPVLRSASPVPVEIYTPQFFKKNPTPSLFDALQQVNGVRPQLNCNVCNTGDIHINGLEGPYTMVLIDGMPIVSSLASVYGLSGIPNALVERIEVVKGPASSLYGSEAIGGLINVITQSPAKGPAVTMDMSATSWGEYNLDAGARYRLSGTVTGLLGINYFNYSHPIDRNGDGFTDLTLQDRISVFNKYQFKRQDERQAGVAFRYVYEDRWGGETKWNKQFRGGDSVYGESIYTSRFELIGNYQLPVQEKLLFAYSYNSHSQRSVYGTTVFNAVQNIAFGQLTWDKKAGSHDLLAGLAGRFTWYDDNTTATMDTLTGSNRISYTPLPGVFVQDEWQTGQLHWLWGARLDHHPVHGLVFTPRLAGKLTLDERNSLRLNMGTGFRVVNLFTEDHAALTGARAVVLEEALEPERSYNVNLNYLGTLSTSVGWLTIDASAWYTYFTNRILPDYETNPNQIIYRNLQGYAESRGVSANLQFGLVNGLKGHIGATVMDVSVVDQATAKKERSRQLLTENWQGTWSLSYTIPATAISVDYTGNVYGPMLLPLLSSLDPRPGKSPVWSIQNIQCTYKLSEEWELYGGVKNLLNWTPARSAPFIIARSQDPFDKQVEFDNTGQVVPTAGNPYALSFDPAYVYASSQGIRGFAGVRYRLKTGK